jgi:hypothetical protein
VYERIYYSTLILQCVKNSFLFQIAQSIVIFTPQATYSTGTYPNSVAVADVNGDNKPDIIVANSGSNNVSVFLSLGQTGNFTE